MKFGYLLFFIGVVSFIAGIAWLTYLDVKIRNYYTLDNDTNNKRVAWAVMLSLIGLVCASVGGFITMAAP